MLRFTLFDLKEKTDALTEISMGNESVPLPNQTSSRVPSNSVNEYSLFFSGSLKQHRYEMYYLLEQLFKSLSVTCKIKKKTAVTER